MVDLDVPALNGLVVSIVIPFSRSRSVESITRSATSWFSRTSPPPEHPVDERGLPVVDMRHDGDVAEIVAEGGARLGHGQPG